MTHQTPAEIREQLLHALDFSACQNAGYTSPEDLLAAYDTSRTPAASRAALRETVAETLARTDGWTWAHGLEFKDISTPSAVAYRKLADAVLALLPTTDRASALREAADAVFALDYDDLVSEQDDENLGSMREAWDLGTIHASQLLRRMADETATEHRPAVSRWRVETLDNLANEWAPGTGWPVRALAVERFDAMNAQAPRWKDGTPVTRRLVRETTTYTVEAERTPAAGARQDETATETPDVYLTTPCDACDHTLNWHSSGETGCTVPRCACARYYHAAGARQDGAAS